MLGTMSLGQIAAIFAAGLGAGFINVLVGSGTLITFPLLLLFGIPALTANISSGIGLVAGNFSGVWGYRHEIIAHRYLVNRLLPASIAGGITGAVLLLLLPSNVFDFVVPALIALGLVLVAVGPAIQHRTAKNLTQQSVAQKPSFISFISVFILGIYGGYFGAAQGVIMMGILGLLLTLSLQDLNAVKNVLVAAVNLLSAFVYTIFAFNQVNWLIVLLIAGGASLGGWLGARVGKKLPAAILRGVILFVGSIALFNLLT